MHQFMSDLWRRTNITVFMIARDVEEAVFLANRIYALGARPGNVRKVIAIDLPDRTQTVKRHSIFHDYRDELMELLRRHGQSCDRNSSLRAKCQNPMPDFSSQVTSPKINDC